MSAPKTSPTQAGSDSTLASTSRCRSIFNFLSLAVPITLTETGTLVPNFFVASYVGRNLATPYLSGFILASMTATISTFAFLRGFFMAADTLSPQAFGAQNYSEVGILAIRGFLGSLFLVVIPLNIILLIFMEDILLFFGQNPTTATYAVLWYRNYVLTLPFYTLFQATFKFLAAQSVMGPLVLNSVISVFVVLPVALAVLTHYYGYEGSAWAVVVFQATQAFLLLLHIVVLHPHHKHTWPGFKVAEALQPDKLWRYLKLGLPGMLGASGMIFFEGIALMVGTYGIIALSAQGIAAQMQMFPALSGFGVGGGLAIRTGYILPRSVPRAQRFIVTALSSAAMFFAAMALTIYFFRKSIFGLFTTDEAVIEACEIIWPRACFCFFHTGLFGCSMGSVAGLGKQFFMAKLKFTVMWVIAFPCAYYWIVVKDGGLSAAWTIYYVPPVVIVNVFLASLLVWDWNEISHQIRLREGLSFENNKGDGSKGEDHGDDQPLMADPDGAARIS